MCNFFLQRKDKLNYMKQTFVLGDRWLYYKLYCGNRTADTILINAIKPLAEELLKKELIDKWFFIRYFDTDNHLRIRFHLNDTDNIGAVIKEFNKSISQYISDDLIWKIQTDTYQRELQRYGTKNIINAESFFYIDSLTCVNALDLIADENILFLFALRSIDNLLDIFNVDLKSKVTFVKQNLQAYKKEFNSDKQLNKQLNLKYQNLKDKIYSFMSITSVH